MTRAPDIATLSAGVDDAILDRGEAMADNAKRMAAAVVGADAAQA